MRAWGLMLVAAVFVAGAASATDSILWKNLNGWSVYMDPTLGNGCYVATGYDDGTMLRLGFNFTTAQPTIYLALGNANWKSLEDGKDYPIQIQFDRNAAWDATATVFSIDETKYLGVSTTDVNFADEFRRKLSLKATFQGREVAHLRLNGSSSAITEMLNCQTTVNAYTSKNSGPKPVDPFEAKPPAEAAKDPFAL